MSLFELISTAPGRPALLTLHQAKYIAHDLTAQHGGGARVYFVAETKSSTIEKDSRHNENLKIACCRKPFAVSKDVVALEGLAVCVGGWADGESRW